MTSRQLNRFIRPNDLASPHHLRRRPRGGRLEGRGVLRAQRPAGRRRRDPGPDPGRRRASWAGRPATGPARCRLPGAGRRPGHRPPAGDPRRGPVLPGVHRRDRVGAGPPRPVPAAAGRAGPRARAGRVPPARRRRPGRRGLPHRPAGRRPPPRAARRARPAGGLRSARTASAAACRASPSTTGPGIAAAVAHLVELGHRHIAHVAGPARVRPRRLAARGLGTARCAAPGLPERPVRGCRLLGPGRRRRHRGAARPGRTRRPRSSTPTT